MYRWISNCWNVAYILDHSADIRMPANNCLRCRHLRCHWLSTSVMWITDVVVIPGYTTERRRRKKTPLTFGRWECMCGFSKRNTIPHSVAYPQRVCIKNDDNTRSGCFRKLTFTKTNKSYTKLKCKLFKNFSFEHRKKR